MGTGSVKSPGRGKTWERMVEDQHADYTRRGLCIWFRNEPRRVRRNDIDTPMETEARRKRGRGAPDYTVGYSGITIFVETKEYRAKTWPLSQLDQEQAERMDAAHRQGFSSFVLLRLAGETWLLPWHDLSYHYYRRTMDARAPTSFSPTRDRYGIRVIGTDYLPSAKACAARRHAPLSSG